MESLIELMLQVFNSLDIKLLFWVHQNVSNPILDWLMPVITNQNNWIIPVLILIFYLGFNADKRGRITLTILLISIIAVDSISAQILKPFFERIRPSHVYAKELNLLVSKGGQWSMPSNHAANVFALAVVLSYFYEKVKIPLFVLAWIIAFSRVYVGVHYPGDVLVGGILGYGLAWIILTLWVILKMRELKRGRTWTCYKGQPPKSIL